MELVDPAGNGHGRILQLGHHYVHRETGEIARFLGALGGRGAFLCVTGPSKEKTLNLPARDFHNWTQIQLPCGGQCEGLGDQAMAKGQRGGPCATAGCCDKATGINPWEISASGDNYRCDTCNALILRMAPELSVARIAQPEIYKALVAAVLALPRAMLRAGQCVVCSEPFTAETLPIPVPINNAGRSDLTYVCPSHSIGRHPA